MALWTHVDKLGT